MKRWIMGFWSALVLSLAGAAGADPGPARPPARERPVTLREVASEHGMTLRGPREGLLDLRGHGTHLQFETEGRSFRLNGLLLWLNAPVTVVRGRWGLATADARKVVRPLLNPGPVLRAQRCRVVVLDPGHGGHDRGARGRRGTEEKDVVLDIARRARAHLVNAGLKVYLTRDGDRFIPLEERCQMAARWGADLFVSIHLNAAVSTTAKGLETYVLALPGYPPTSAESAARVERIIHPGNRHDQANGLAGYFLHKALVEKARGEDRGLRRARFVVLREAPCPAVLLECGFLSHAGEESKMLDAAHRETLALAIARGVLDYRAAILKAQPPK